MAAGCIVVGDVTDGVRDEVESHTGAPVPIVQATPTTLEQVLRDLADDGDFDARREEGVAFVRAVHDGRLAARALIANWIAPTPAGREEVTGASDR